jgi:hypothetical protein
VGKKRISSLGNGACNRDFSVHAKRVEMKKRGGEKKKPRNWKKQGNIFEYVSQFCSFPSCFSEVHRLKYQKL